MEGRSTSPSFVRLSRVCCSGIRSRAMRTTSLQRKSRGWRGLKSAMAKRDKRAERPPGGRWPQRPNKPREAEPCVYCGTRPAEDREHVFAKAFFNPRPNPTITVPACGECNKRRGDGGMRDMTLDEEYARTILCMMAGAEKNRTGARVLEQQVFKSFDRRPALIRVQAESLEDRQPRRHAQGCTRECSCRPRPFMSVRPNLNRLNNR